MSKRKPLSAYNATPIVRANVGKLTSTEIVRVSFINHALATITLINAGLDSAASSGSKWVKSAKDGGIEVMPRIVSKSVVENGVPMGGKFPTKNDAIAYLQDVIEDAKGGDFDDQFAAVVKTPKKPA